MLLACVDESSHHIKGIIKAKADEYLKRASTIKEYLKGRKKVPVSENAEDDKKSSSGKK